MFFLEKRKLMLIVVNNKERNVKNKVNLIYIILSRDENGPARPGPRPGPSVDGLGMPVGFYRRAGSGRAAFLEPGGPGRPTINNRFSKTAKFH